ncbi:craniofacial development protein 2-like [Apostichopus japonicus]|uniref:craniofacial development protein 2-like n=1 Tax=Stichopus japonicus TaxID=307972 RepID=UPI003AB21E2A
MADLNAKVGKKEDGEESVIGNFGYGQRNDRGDGLVEFAISSKLKILNTFFKKKANRKWTWISPDRATKNEIDFILSSDLNIVKDVNVLNKVNIGSDHRMKIGKFPINTKLERQKLLRPKYSNINLDKLTERNHEFQLELANKFGTLNDEWREQDLDTWNQETIDIIQ